MAIVAR
jgi:hypothetical protein